MSWMGSFTFTSRWPIRRDRAGGCNACQVLQECNSLSMSQNIAHYYNYDFCGGKITQQQYQVKIAQVATSLLCHKLP